MPPRTLITGANGYVGGLLCQQLCDRGWSADDLSAIDLSDSLRADLPQSIPYRSMDVRDEALRDFVRQQRTEVVVHLAAVVTPGPGMSRQTQYEIDVEGTRNVVSCALAGGCRRLVVTSSGAAYGYHEDHPEWIEESAPIRGNVEFAYAHHKRLVEEMLEKTRREQPQFEQVVLRMGTVLGAQTRNQITDLFDGRFLIGVTGGDDRFVFVWDQDVVACLERAVEGGPPGVFNLAGDGAMSVGEIGARLNRRYVRFPGRALQAALWLGRKAGLTPYGPEQVRFLKYRPVLSNRRLKEEFGFKPQKTSREVFELFAQGRGL